MGGLKPAGADSFKPTGLTTNWSIYYGGGYHEDPVTLHF
jgi:hypothetical protein